MAAPDLKLLKDWEDAVDTLLDRTLKFPRVARFTFANRIDNLALDILEHLVDARYASGRAASAPLREADAQLTKLRVLLRLSQRRQYLAPRAFEHLMRQVDACGRMLGGWRGRVGS